MKWISKNMKDGSPKYMLVIWYASGLRIEWYWMYKYYSIG